MLCLVVTVSFIASSLIHFILKMAIIGSTSTNLYCFLTSFCIFAQSLLNLDSWPLHFRLIRFELSARPYINLLGFSIYCQSDSAQLEQYLISKSQLQGSQPR